LNNFLSKKAKSLTPYIAGLQPQEAGWIKLNTNENPYPPSAKVIEALQTFDYSRLRLYPDGSSDALKKTIAEDTGLSPENVFCGNGSDEVLALAFQAFFSGKDNILTPDISYGFYPVWAEMYDVGLKVIPLNQDFTLNPDGYKDANGIIIANPNAPTSLAIENGKIEQILSQNPDGVVLIDEAYIEFSDVKSVTKLYDNLLVVRTFSKSHSLAGMRVGYALGPPNLINALERVRDAFNSYPLDMLAQTAAIAAIKDKDYTKACIEKVIKTRESTANRLMQLGCQPLKSHTNFLMIKTPHAAPLYQYLLYCKILARYWNKPRLRDYLRVTIGTDSEMEAFLQCVKEFQ